MITPSMSWFLSTTLKYNQNGMRRKSDIFNSYSLKLYLDINITQRSVIFYTDQKNCINKTLTGYGMMDTKKSKIPLDPGYFKSKESKDYLCTYDNYRRKLSKRNELFKRNSQIYIMCWNN